MKYQKLKGVGFVSQLFALLYLNVALSHAEKMFTTTGPVLTMTLTDSDSKTSASSQVMKLISNQRKVSPPSLDNSIKKKWSSLTRDIHLSSLRPTLQWSIQTLGPPPLADKFPSFKSCRAKILYRLDKDASLESNAIFLSEHWGTIIEVQPKIYSFKQSRDVNMVIRASKLDGSSYIMGRFSPCRKILDFARGSYEVKIPIRRKRYLSSSTTNMLPVNSIRFTPSYDFITSTPSCIIESQTLSGRTKAIVTVQKNHEPKLMVAHALDERNTISPEISLHTKRITYQWNRKLDLAGASSINAKVDPSSSVHFTWTDDKRNGNWIVDFHVPLAVGTTKISSLVPRVKVRKQFKF